MPSLDDVYRKFGEVSEAAQLVETDLGTMLFFFDVVEEELITPTLEVDLKGAAAVLERINRQTLGQLLKNAKRHTDGFDRIETLLSHALSERNRLAHSFYRQHNFCKNTEAGRAIMMQDLEEMHETMLKAFKELSLLSGIDLEALVQQIDRARENRDTMSCPPDETAIFHVPI